MIAQSAMDQDGHVDQDSNFHHDNWADVHSYTSMAMSTYGGDYYTQAVAPSMSLDSYSSIQMAPPPNPIPLRHQQQNVYSTQLPHGLLIPSQQPSQVPWPSLQTNPSRSFAAPPVPIPPASAPPRVSQNKLPSTTTSGPRKTLTIEDRRAMCKFAEENPNVKQTEIGARFGVERSTVSKTLRNRDKFLSKSEDRSNSPIQRNKGKSPPDIERALSIWAKSTQKKGLVINDADLEDKARFFCAGVDNEASKLITRAWIEKFKQKHGIGPGRLLRRASETALPDSTRYKSQQPLLSASSTTTQSPASPTVRTSPLGSSNGNEGKNTLSISMDFENLDQKHRQPQSATTIPSAVTDPSSTSFSTSAISPTSAFTFSPDLNSSIFDNLHSNHGQHRPRSQTFPHIDPLEYLGETQGSESFTPKFQNSASTALESPSQEMQGQQFNFDTPISPPVLRHASSNSSLTGRSTASGAVSGTPISAPNSPTQDDARRAADTLLSYISSTGFPGLMDKQDYDAVVRLTDKLRLQQQQQQQQQQQHSQISPSQALVAKLNSSSGQGLGILSRIPEGDAEMMHSPQSGHV